MEIAEKKIVFVAGLHRSGTSILFKCLRAHPEMSGFKDTGAIEDEGQLLQSVYPPARAYGGPGRFGFNKEAHLTESSSLVSESNARQLFEDWSPYWDLSRPVLLEKSPPNLIRARFLQALFPRSMFVVITRHPIAVSYATLRGRGRRVFHRLMRHWVVCHRIFERDMPYLKDVLCLHYEDLVADPERALGSIFKFIGLENAVPHTEIRKNTNEKYFAQWKDEASTFPGRTHQMLLKTQLERSVQRFGYSLRDQTCLRESVIDTPNFR